MSSNQNLFRIWSSIRKYTSQYINYNSYTAKIESIEYAEMRRKIKQKKDAYFHIFKENPSPFSTSNIYSKNNKKFINSIIINSHPSFSQDEIINAFVQHYENIFKGPEVMDIFPSQLDPINSNEVSTSLSPITSNELISFAKHLPSGKAPGPDGFPNELLKFMVFHNHKFFLSLFNQWFTQSKPLPSFIKRSLITFIPKVEYPTQIRDWRPISLLNTVYKLYSAIINKRLLTLFDPYLHKSQLGFREGRWIHENLLLLHLVSFITKYDSLDVDIESAFPSLSHKFLLNIIDQRAGVKWRNIIQNIKNSIFPREKANPN